MCEGYRRGGSGHQTRADREDDQTACESCDRSAAGGGVGGHLTQAGVKVGLSLEWKVLVVSVCPCIPRDQHSARHMLGIQ